ncbi:MAG: KpsF/GutQ family sugar-phosphate isomerase [Acidobacteria bacterium]|nr:KpsF/GutQ family sugar-phosphate isomerase [Acidobacteriota bacterium]
MVDLALARRVLHTEADAVRALADRLDERFSAAVALVRDCRGRVILTGMGKSGIVCRKIAATLSSTGTPAYFVHPAEAVHGDLGMIQPSDVVIALSHSGETEELTRLLETLKRLGATLIALTGNPASTLGRAATVVLDCSVPAEACPMNLVPTASTTAALALGDALAMSVLVEKGFSPDNFADLHPRGTLFRRARRVDGIMRSGDGLPSVPPGTPMRDVIAAITRGGMGIACVTAADGTLAGVVTDGDVRRALAADTDVLALRADDTMSRSPVVVAPDVLAAEALHLLEERRITALVVVDDDRRVLGVVHLHDLWRTGLV